jgi:Uma2 family endonuclease
MTRVRYTSADLERMQRDEWHRYEIVDGELCVSTAPREWHQNVSAELWSWLRDWNNETGIGLVFLAPGLIFADDDDVIPDLIWMTKTQFAQIHGVDGHFHGPPELVVEILSPGSANERRDRTIKLGLYSRRGVLEYWLVDWQLRLIDVYRRGGEELRLVATLTEADNLESPLLPGFSRLVSALFNGIPADT